MKIFGNLASVAMGALALTFVSASVQAADPPPLPAYGNLPDIEQMALSNDGTRIAAVMSIKGERVVVLMNSDFKTLRMMRLEDQKVRSMEWVRPDSLMAADAVGYDKDAGKPYEFVVLNGEDHWLSRSETRNQMLEAAVAFVEKYNPAN